MTLNIKRIAAGSLALAMLIGTIPVQASAAVAPSAQTILKQSFANLDKAASYDMNGSVGITLPAAMLGSAAPEGVLPYLVNGKELRSYFTGSFDKAAKSYQVAATSYNARTGESPRVEIVGNEDGVMNFRVGGFALNAPSSPEIAMLQHYANTWIRIDPTDLPVEVSPLLMPLVGKSETVNYSAGEPSSVSVSAISAAEKKKAEEMNAKIEKAFWTRNVITARRLADAKDHTGAPAYRLGLKLNSVGARLFVLDIAKIIGSKPGASDIKELNKMFAKLPIFSGDLIVNKKSMLPELLAISVSGFEKKAADDVKIAFKISFEHVGSGRAVTMPLQYIPVQTVIDQVTNATTSSVAAASCMSNGTCPVIVDPQPCVIYGGCEKQ